MQTYRTRIAADGQPHMYFVAPIEDRLSFLIYPAAHVLPVENIYQSGIVYFDTLVFKDWIQRPLDITDTFEMFGLSWIVIDKNLKSRQIKCLPESPVTHLLAIRELLNRTGERLRWHYLNANLNLDLAFRGMEDY